MFYIFLFTYVRYVSLPHEALPHLPAAGANELPIRSSEAGFYRDQVGSGEAVPGEEEARII